MACTLPIGRHFLWHSSRETPKAASVTMASRHWRGDAIGHGSWCGLYIYIYLYVTIYLWYVLYRFMMWEWHVNDMVDMLDMLDMDHVTCSIMPHGKWTDMNGNNILKPRSQWLSGGCWVVDSRNSTDERSDLWRCLGMINTQGVLGRHGEGDLAIPGTARPGWLGMICYVNGYKIDAYLWHLLMVNNGL